MRKVIMILFVMVMSGVKFSYAQMKFKSKVPTTEKFQEEFLIPRTVFQ